MKRNLLAAIGAVLTVVGASAQASNTFPFEIRGFGQYYEWGQPPLPDGNPLYPAGWFGEMFITTSSAADGTYTGASLEAISFDSKYFGPNDYWAGVLGLDYKSGDPMYEDWTDEGAYLYGMTPGASVTLAGGKVTSVNFHWAWDWGAGITVDGTTITAEGTPFLGHHSGFVDVAGTALPVPEVPIAILLLAGLMVTGTRLRAETRRPHSPRQSGNNRPRVQVKRCPFGARERTFVG